MIPGLMQSAPLMISGILTYAAQAHGAREIVSRLIDEPLWRYDYAGLARRAAQAAHALHRLGVAPGDRVQFERKGYFCADSSDSKPGAPVFNRTVTLSDTWAKIETRGAGA